MHHDDEGLPIIQKKRARKWTGKIKRLLKFSSSLDSSVPVGTLLCYFLSKNSHGNNLIKERRKNEK
jgi:hypothetical protein